MSEYTHNTTVFSLHVYVWRYVVVYRIEKVLSLTDYDDYNDFQAWLETRGSFHFVLKGLHPFWRIDME